jgi:hypothetical protein
MPRILNCRVFVLFTLPPLGRPCRPAIEILHLMHELIECRQRQQGEERRGDQSADHDDRQRPFDLRAVKAQHRQR